MDIKEYIESGILESYVMGIASEQEVKEVQCLSNIYPELKQELNKIENTLTQYIQSIAVTPPSSLKEKILSQIKNEEQIKPISTNKDKEAKVISISQGGSRSNFFKYAASIAIIIAIASVLGFLNEKKNASVASIQLNEYKTEQSDKLNILEKEIAALESKIENQNLKEAILANQTTQAINLGSTPVGKDANAKVYWNSNESKLVIVSESLPYPPDGMQYQLWAISDGTPIDLGVLDKSNKISSLVDLDTSNIQAFAITLETDGGNPTPNLEQLYVIGNV